ncbi:hypothetical protein GCM10017690_31690 [Microbacterium terregens]
MTYSMYGRIELTRVDDDCWRLCDGALPQSDPSRIIAFAEKKNGHVTLLWLRQRSGQQDFATFEQALRATEATVYELDGQRTERPRPIPHFPPLAG